MFELRPFQKDLKAGLYDSWNQGARNTMLVLPTGGGKTVIMSDVAKDQSEPTVAIAHRKELVGQISNALANMGIPHNVVGSDGTISFCINQHIAKFGRSYFDRNSMFHVASVDTINARRESLVQWGSTIKTWMTDECHHLLSGNKWGKAVDLFPNARGVGYTASPIRCDRKSLARSQGGVFDDMRVGPSMRDLINGGYLADYRIFGPPKSINTDEIAISKSTGDYQKNQLRDATNRSTITGDIVQHYLKIAGGKRGITFTVDVDNAIKTAAAFRNAGVPAEAISANTPDGVREQLIQKFIDGKILQLVNVDLFGEGFDVPAVEVVSMGRPTQSFGLYLQQFGRALRTAPGKERGIVIDHVGNVITHGLPDAVRTWTLYSEPGRRRAIRDPDVMPVTTCTSCFLAYMRIFPACPYCGVKPEPSSRSEPKYVDGDLQEFSPELIAALRGEINRIEGKPLIPVNASDAIAAGIRKNWRNRQNAQHELRDAIARWAGIRKHVHKEPDPVIHRRFYHRFGTDIMTAQTLGKPEAEALKNQIEGTLH